MFKKQWMVLGVLPIAALLVLGARGVSNPGGVRASDTCPAAPYVSGQPIVETYVDATPSTNQPALRRAYHAAAARVLTEAVAKDAFVRLAVFGGALSSIRAVCETSTQTASTAPLFAEAQATGIKESLAALLARAVSMRATDPGSDIYAALVDGVQHAEALRAGSRAPVHVYVWTDGDQAAGHVHLRRLLESKSDRLIARQIMGSQPAPDARGITIEVRGVGVTGTHRPASTAATRRMAHVWELICEAMHATRCLASPDLT
jgi:hypothetical protein